MRLTGNGGVDVPPGQMGELWVHSPCNSDRYWGEAGAARMRSAPGGWIGTGDLLMRDHAGQYVFVGRSDDLLKISGVKVAPVEIEQTLLEHPAVRECVVSAVTGRHGMPRLAAFVVLRPGSRDASDVFKELKPFAAGRLAPHKVPALFFAVPDLPRGTTGKVDRGQVRVLMAQCSKS